MGTIGGVVAALWTPFNGYGGIDTDGVGRLVARAIAGGVAGVLVNATIGEAPHLSRGERIFVIEAAIEAAAGRAPVYAGTGANSSEEALALTWDAGKAGVAAAFVATPAYYPLPQAALLDHYRLLARRARLPLVPLGDPAAGNALAPAALAALADLDGVAALALADDGDAALPAALAAVGDRAPVLAARDRALLAALGGGAAGVVSALAGLLPGEVVALARAARDGDVAGAVVMSGGLAPLAALLDDRASGVAACKAAATVLGLPGGSPRSPLPGASEETRAAIGEVVAAVVALENGG